MAASKSKAASKLVVQEPVAASKLAEFAVQASLTDNWPSRSDCSTAFEAASALENVAESRREEGIVTEDISAVDIEVVWWGKAERSDESRELPLWLMAAAAASLWRDSSQTGWHWSAPPSTARWSWTSEATVSGADLVGEAEPDEVAAEVSVPIDFFVGKRLPCCWPTALPPCLRGQQVSFHLQRHLCHPPGPNRQPN